MVRSVESAIIIGGGIGGLSAAIALQRAGIEPLVFERARNLSKIQIGGGVILWHNAVLALRELGLGAQFESIAPAVEFHEFRSWKGKRLANWPVGEKARELQVPTLSISRPVIHQLLVNEVGPQVRFGAVCTGFAADDDGVTALFADGSEARADVLLGADGLRSVVRAQLHGEEPPRPAGYTAWQGVCDFPDRRAPDGVFCNLWGRGLRFLFFRIDRGDLLYWDGVTPAGEGGRSLTHASKRETVLNRFRGWHEPIEAMIEATAEQAITPIDIYDRPPVRQWGQGRVSLLGDAAHPMTFNLGQGACQAIEGGVVVGKELAAGGDPAAALRRYEQRRIERTTSMVNTARNIGRLGLPKNRVFCSARDVFMRAAFDRIAFKQNYELMMDVRL